MAGRFVIMAARENGAVKGVVCGDIDTALVYKDACLDLPVSELRTEGKRNVLMHGLESLEDEGIACGGGFDVMRKGGIDEVNKKGQWEEGDIGVVRVIHGEEVGAAGEGVGAGEELSGYVDHLEVEISEVD